MRDHLKGIEFKGEWDLILHGLMVKYLLQEEEALSCQRENIKSFAINLPDKQSVSLK
jgi:hypothetical protein